MAAFTFFVKEHFNPIAQSANEDIWHADIGLQKTFGGVSRQNARVTDFSSVITPPLVSKFCDLQAFKVRLVSRFLQDKKPQPLFASNDDHIAKLPEKRNIFQPYRFR